jgi:hypothetical protein
MDSVIQIKLHKRLPDLTPEQEKTMYEIMAEMYRRGYDDAKEKLCEGCSYKGYYSRVAAQNDCNDCGNAKTCPHAPRPGSIVRINCPLWRAKG